MRIIILGILIFCMISCGKKTPESSSFELIDVSMYNGWTDFYCLKVFKDGKTYIFNDKLRKGETYFRVNLGIKEIDSISSLVKIILSSKLDTLYVNACQDCGSYNLIIKTKEKKFKSFVNGIWTDKEIECMNYLISYLYKIADTSMASIDSVFIFESRTKHFYPPPPPPINQLHKFIPPNANDKED